MAVTLKLLQLRTLYNIKEFNNLREINNKINNLGKWGAQKWFAQSQLELQREIGIYVKTDNLGKL